MVKDDANASELRSLLQDQQRQLDALRDERDRIQAELDRIERGLASSERGGAPRVRRLLRWYDRRSDELIGSAPLHDVDSAALRRMFDRPDDDPMYEAYPVAASQASQLQAWVDVPILLDRFAYFVETDGLGVSD